jgi:two-component system, LytTR family, sensor kinase
MRAAARAMLLRCLIGRPIRMPSPLSPPPRKRAWWSRWPAIALAAYTLLAVLYAIQVSVYRASQDEAVIWTEDLLAGLAEWYAWAALTPLIVVLVRRMNARGRTWRFQLAVHVPAAFIFAVAHLALLAALRQLFRLDAAGWPLSRDLFPLETAGWAAASVRFLLALFKRVDSDMLIYAMLVGAGAALRYHDQYRARDLRASQLEAQLAQAQLQLLRSQLHPHFLFNTLHAISTLMHRDVDAADRMMSRLSELLRISLNSAERHQVALADELEFLAPYLDIERTRFSDRLRVDVDVAESARQALVPALLLQPLVENAIRHGIAPRRGPGHVTVRAERQGDRLVLDVSDDGVGPPPALEEGIGLGNVRQRLARLHGDDFAMSAGARQPAGFTVRIAIPFQAVDP